MADGQIPIANWPAKSGEYKVVQLDVDGQPHLRFGEKGYESHTIILDSLARKLGRDYPGMKKVWVPTTPPLQSAWYRVYGMGRAKVNLEEKQASFWGDSFAYGIGIDAEQLERIRPLVPDWVLELR